MLLNEKIALHSEKTYKLIKHYLGEMQSSGMLKKVVHVVINML
jgi:hypothetical protein